MTTFRFMNNETGEQFDDFLSNSRREELLDKNPHITQIPTPFAIVSTVATTVDSKTDDGFKEVLQRIGENHPGSEIDERYNRRSVKQSQTKRVLDKHRSKWKVS